MVFHMISILHFVLSFSNLSLILWIIILLANIVLENTTERLFVGNVYGDIPLGLFVVRGDNIVLIGDMV